MELRDKNGLTEKEFLAKYRPGDYERPSVTVDMLVFAAPGLSMPANRHLLADGTLKLLMIRRGGHPFLGCYALPGGFVNSSETVLTAAKRELWEETHAQGIPLRQLYTFSRPGRDPRTWVMSCAHLAVLDTDHIPVKAGDDADRAEWFTVTLTEDQGTGRYELTLSNGSVTLSASLSCPALFEEEACVVHQSSGIAFDHSQMILCALKALFHF